jgi:ABC-type Fe3+/spermidine/putrescine transport system ATPase subunit
VQRLSGGEVQRVALARALVQGPSVMLLDEPFHSLDAPVKAAIMAEVQALVKARGLCAALVTHDADEASAMADRALLLRDGRKVQEGTLDDLYRAPVDGWAARFLGEVASIDATAAEAAGVALPRGFEGRTAWFRPEALRLEPAGAGDGLAVIAVRRCRAITEITVALPDGARLVAKCHGESPLTEGSRARARLAWTLPPSLCEEGAEPS